MSAPVVATPLSSRTIPRSSLIVVAAIFVIATSIGLVALAVWSIGSADNSRAVETQSYADGYPMHGGLAGPSRVSLSDPAAGFGAGYPMHGGLAGPSRVSVFEGLSYPHGGLAGPSRVEADR